MNLSCPDCGQSLTGVPLGLAGDTSESFRCYHCGGFWLNAWLVNRINSKILDTWPGAKNQSTFISTSSNACPKDNTELENFRSEAVPPSMHIKQCKTCGWYWFPGNTLFDYKPAQEAKINYFKAWGLATSVQALLLPALVVVLLIVGTTVGVNLVLNQNRTAIDASSEISAVNLGYIGQGEALVSFQAKTQILQIEYKTITDKVWQTQEMKFENNLYITKLTNLTEGELYIVKIAGKEFELRAW